MPSIATTWGSTPGERARSFPCDRTFAEPCLDLYRAVTIDAPPAVAFRWLCQLRVAPYSYDLLDNGGRTSPRTLTPGLDELALGQRVMGIFTLIDFERDRHLTLAMTSPRGRQLFGDIAVSYVLTPHAQGQSRLVVKLRVRRTGSSFVARIRRWLLTWGDLVMMRKQLLTMKELSEATERVSVEPDCANSHC
jgi:hypothetical protein